MKHALCIVLVSSFCLFQTKVSAQQKPNIIYILADDLGYGDVSCYGQEKIETPNIDKLAAQGMQFMQHYAGAPVCAPSRSSLMSGQHTGHTSIRGNAIEKGMDEGQVPMEGSTITLAELLKQAGYKTGAFGKWGLGYIGSEGDANSQGFDEFFGYNCQAVAHRYYPDHLWHNRDKVMLEGNDWKHTVTYAADVIHDKALQFISENKDQPFFMYYPSTLPHAELIVPDDSIFQAERAKFGNETPYLAKKNGVGFDYGDDIVIKEYTTQKYPHATFAAMVKRLDQHVGEIMAKLKELGIEKNTIIIFSSDNGPHDEGGADPEFFNSNGDFRGIKRDVYEGGIREPMLVKWPAKVKAGSKTNNVSAFWDVMPTLAEIAHVKTPKESDGISFLPTLLGKKQKQHDYLYWEFHEKNSSQAVRLGQWKGIRQNITDSKDAPIELYDLSKDLGEVKNSAGSHPDIVVKMAKIMNEAHQKNDRFPFDYEIAK
jgi:arylsulfatase A-like enzyme